MKLDVMSDLHLEQKSKEEILNFFSSVENHLMANGSPDALVLAGDIAALDRFRNMQFFLSYFAKLYNNVIYIPGNHEFWGSTFHVPAIHINGIHALSTYEDVFVGGQRFYGDTGWFPDPVDPYMCEAWPDFVRIKGLGYPDGPERDIYTAHRQFVDSMKDYVDSDTVLVTHHFPLESTAPRWSGSPTNPFFAFDFGAVRPKIHIHGHTHDPVDYIHPNGHRVYCNPKGYKYENANAHFWDRIRIDI